MLRRALAVTITEKEESVAEKDLHYYEPAKGHGLKHDPFNAIVAPRPIGFSSTSWKDSVANLKENGRVRLESRD